MADKKRDLLNINKAIRYKGVLDKFTDTGKLIYEKGISQSNNSEETGQGTYDGVPFSNWRQRAWEVVEEVSDKSVLVHDTRAIREELELFLAKRLGSSSSSILDTTPKIKKPPQESYATMKLETAAKNASERISEKQIDALKEQIANIEHRDVVISRMGLREAANKVRPRLSPGQIEELVHSIPEKEVIQISNSEFADIPDETIRQIETDRLSTPEAIPQFGQFEAQAPTASLGLGQQAAGAVTQKAVGKILEKPTEKIVEKVGTKVAGSLFARFTGFLAGGVGGIVTLIGPDVVSWLKRHSQQLPIVLGGIVGVLGAGIIGISPVLGAGLGGTAGYALGGAGQGLSGVANSLAGLVTALLSITAGAFVGPLIVAVLLLPILVALILFIINSGAYITPVGPSTIPNAIVSPYIDVKKTATPNCINRQGEGCGDFGEVSFHVSISPKKGALTNIRIKNDYLVTGSNAPIPNPTIEDLNNIPESIGPAGNFSFDYTIDVGKEYDDSLITDTVTVTADSPEQKDAVAATSATITVGNPKIDCPLAGGHITWGSYNGEASGHGSNAYWNAVGRACSYPLPQISNCFSPSNSSANVCSGKPSCPFYGYAIDVFPSGSTEVIAPTINGESLEWEHTGVPFPNGGGKSGWSHNYTDTTGRYSILFTHIKNNPVISGEIKSGEKIGELFDQGSNTHLHMEFQVNGQYQKPELYFCR